MEAMELEQDFEYVPPPPLAAPATHLKVAKLADLDVPELPAPVSRFKPELKVATLSDIGNTTKLQVRREFKVEQLKPLDKFSARASPAPLPRSSSNGSTAAVAAKPPKLKKRRKGTGWRLDDSSDSDGDAASPPLAVARPTLSEINGGSRNSQTRSVSSRDAPCSRPSCSPTRSQSQGHRPAPPPQQHQQQQPPPPPRRRKKGLWNSASDSDSDDGAAPPVITEAARARAFGTAAAAASPAHSATDVDNETDAPARAPSPPVRVASAFGERDTSERCLPQKRAAGAADRGGGGGGGGGGSRKGNGKARRARSGDAEEEHGSEHWGADGYEGGGGEEEAEAPPPVELHPEFENPHFLDDVVEPLELAGGATVPAAANRYLKSFQRETVQWLYERYHRQHGAIAALDMGLGKTVITVCFIAAILGKTGTRADRVALDARERAVRRAEAARLSNRTVVVSRAVVDQIRSKSPVLVVVPASTRESWRRHFRDWGHFAVGLLPGGSKGGEALTWVRAGLYEVVITTYDTFKDAVKPEGAASLTEVKWEAIFFDEYHLVKNPLSQRGMAAAEFRGQTLIYGLTGTPIQNNLKELWWLMDLAVPDCLGDRDMFKAHFDAPLRKGRMLSATKTDVELEKRRQAELDAIVKRHMLILKKETELAEYLPARSMHIVFCNPTPLQQGLYRAMLDLPEFKLLATASTFMTRQVLLQQGLYCAMLDLPEFKLLATARQPCDCGRVHEQTGLPLERGKCCWTLPLEEDAYGRPTNAVDARAALWFAGHPNGLSCVRCPWCCLFPALSRLSKVANHPAALQYDVRWSADKKRQAATFLECLPEVLVERMGGLQRSQRFEDMSDASMSGKLGDMSDASMSGKLGMVKALLHQFNAERKRTLLCSLSTQTLDVIEACVIGWGYERLRLDGATPLDQRQRIVDEFNRMPGAPVLLVSTRAGGIGLNINGASRVIIYDVNWNPSHDHQAQDRCYRIGQDKAVEVYRLISCGTIEELIYMRQLYKVQLAGSALDSKAGGGGARHFNAMQGVRGEEGELFGVANLLRHSDTSMLAEVRQRYQRKMTARGGGSGGGAAAAANEHHMTEDMLRDMMQRAAAEAAAAPDEDDAELDDEARAERAMLLELLGAQAMPPADLTSKAAADEGVTDDEGEGEGGGKGGGADDPLRTGALPDGEQRKVSVFRRAPPPKERKRRGRTAAAALAAAAGVPVDVDGDDGGGGGAQEGGDEKPPALPPAPAHLFIPRYK